MTLWAATKAALAEGIVAGGGVQLCRAGNLRYGADSLPVGRQILKDVEATILQIMKMLG